MSPHPSPLLAAFGRIAGLLQALADEFRGLAALDGVPVPGGRTRARHRPAPSREPTDLDRARARFALQRQGIHPREQS